MSEKYYVVWHGKKNGIYNSWPDCEKEVKNVKDAKFIIPVIRCEIETKEDICQLYI